MVVDLSRASACAICSISFARSSGILVVIMVTLLSSYMFSYNRIHELNFF